MRLDYEKYRPLLSTHQLSTEEENELIDYLWNFVSAHVDRAFEMHPVQLAQHQNKIASKAKLIVRKEGKVNECSRVLH